jgi:hypothetical protein
VKRIPLSLLPVGLARITGKPGRSYRACYMARAGATAGRYGSTPIWAPRGSLGSKGGKEHRERYEPRQQQLSDTGQRAPAAVEPLAKILFALIAVAAELCADISSQDDPGQFFAGLGRSHPLLRQRRGEQPCPTPSRIRSNASPS